MTHSQLSCTSCGAVAQADAAFCALCGASLTPAPGAGPTILDRLRASLGDVYKVERVLGVGGMATVYLAQDVRHDRQVAIKVLNPELSVSVGAERFDREIRVSAKLHHPHILPLYDSGSADGLLYYVMPFVQGESLRDRINREKMLPVEDALAITIEVADALGYAHGLGIVHRDIKPENIMLTGGHALVADFGIARAVGGAAAEQKLTQTGTAVGTPLYMSPEQSFGDEVGPTSDLYSLACVAYEMLTGDPPFTGSNARAIMARHTMEAVPSIRIVRDAVPEEVESALLVALGKVPADRPQSAKQFVEMLGAAPGTTRITRRLTSTRGRVSLPPAPARKPWWARPLTWGIAAGAAAAAVALWLVLAPRGTAADAGGADPHNIAVLYFDDLSANRDLGYLADGVTEGLIAALSEVSALRIVSKGGVAQVRGADLPLDSVARLFGVGAIVRGSVDREGANDVRVTIRLADASGAELSRATFRKALADPLALRDSAVQEAALLVRGRLREAVEVRQTRAGAGNVEAWVLFQRGEVRRRAADSLAADAAAFERASAEADSLFALAEAADARWADPVVRRAAVAYRSSRRFVDDPAAAARWIDVGLGHAGRALVLDDRSADALEVQGNLRYWKWLLGLERDAARARSLLDSAQANLERAVALRPAQAGAWATLSHLYNQTKSGIDVNNAARRALEADAFLDNAHVIMARLFFSSYDLGQFQDARHWCDEGARRFPADVRFRECRLWMLTTRNEPPDVARAWALRDTLLAGTPPADTAYVQRQAALNVAAVLARAAAEGRPALADSARRVIQRARGTPDIDPTSELANIAAFVYTLLGDRAAAVNAVQQYLVANPSKRESYASDPGWWFASLANDLDYRRVVSSR
jgi:eukaryotic-like serine/threonine-protein kinase